MQTTVELPTALHEKLQAWARDTGQTMEQVICAALKAYVEIPWSLRQDLEAWQAAGSEAVEIVAPIADEAW